MVTRRESVAADRFGVHGIEPLYSHFPSIEAAFLKEFRSSVERAQSRIVNIPVSVGASFYDPDPAQREIAVANSRKWVDVAAALGCPSIRTHIRSRRRKASTPLRRMARLKVLW